MKRAIIVFLGLLSLICCQRKERNISWMEENGKLKILCTTAQIGDLVREVGGERIDTEVLIEGDLDPHSYELVKGDGEKFFRADYIFYNGLGLEHGASLFALLKTSAKALSLGEVIAEKFPQKILYQSSVVDPHLWMDVSLWERGIDPIVDQLSRLDPEGESYYRKRGDALGEKMAALDREIAGRLQNVASRKRYLVTSHDAFGYFARRYLKDVEEKDWQERFRAPEGLAPDGQLSPLDLEEIVEHLKKHEISVIFPESNVSQDAIRKIVSIGREWNLSLEICKKPLYGDATSGKSYFDAMRENGRVIEEHLQ